jgi:hypothetical protein
MLVWLAFAEFVSHPADIFYQQIAIPSLPQAGFSPVFVLFIRLLHLLINGLVSNCSGQTPLGNGSQGTRFMNWDL